MINEFFSSVPLAFTLGVAYNCVKNGLHIGCCHTIKSVTYGCFMIGALSAIIGILLNITFFMIFGSLGGLLSTGNIGVSLMSLGITLHILVMYDNYQMNKYPLIIQNENENEKQESENKQQNGELKVLDN